MTYPIRVFEYATIVYVVDGDTCDIIVDLGFSVKIKQRFRLARINTPEVGKSSYLEAKDFLTTYVGKPLILQVTKVDKYGRYLAEIYANGLSQPSINTDLLLLGLAVPYV